MEMRHLRYFLAVAEEQHFGRAADRLHMAQPPLSQQIRHLEAELGVRLLRRTTRRVELEPAGQVFLERARQILTELDAAIEDTQRAARGELGHLSIGFTGSSTYSLLPSVAMALRDALPSVDLRLHGEMLTAAQVEGLLDRSLDIAFLRPPVSRRELIVEVIQREPLIAVLPERHRLASGDAVSVADLAQLPFVTYPSHFRSVVHDAVERTCEAHGFLPRVALEVAETATLVSFVAAGIGVSLVPASVSQMAVAGAVYRPLADEPGVVELALVRRREEDPLVARATSVIRSRVQAIQSDVKRWGKATRADQTVGKPPSS